jgi:hypothetical protein
MNMAENYERRFEKKGEMYPKQRQVSDATKRALGRTAIHGTSKKK